MAESIKENINRNEKHSKDQRFSGNNHEASPQTLKFKLVLTRIWSGLKAFNFRLGNKTTLITLNRKT